MANVFYVITSFVYKDYFLSVEPWKEPINIFIWFIYGLVIFSGITYSSIFLLKKNFRIQTKRKQELQLIEEAHLKALIQKHIETQENERMRIGSDLHDSISNKLSLILIKLNLGYELGQLELAIKETLLLVRDISHDLNPPFYKDTALHLLIINQFDKLPTNYAISQYLRLYAQQVWSSNYKIQVVRIVQELITNIIKHAKATEILIAIRESNTGLCLIISDNGVGLSNKTTGLGYQNIRNRLFLINGKFKFKSKIDCGTTIIIWIQNEI